MKILLLLVVSYLPFSVQAKNIAVSYFYSHLPPYEFADSNGEAAGIGINKVKAIFTQAGLSNHFHYYSVNKGLHLLRQGKVDFSTVISPNKAIYADFLMSDKPIYYIELGVIRRIETPPIEAIAQLSNYNYAALKETSFLFNKISSQLAHQKRYNVDSVTQGIHLVNIKKLPYFLTYYYAKKTLANNVNFDVLVTEPVYLIISKLHPQAHNLMGKINQAIAQVQHQ